jgi:hypothetical protein
MGCDIYSFAERKIKDTWELVTNAFPADDFEREQYKLEKVDSPFRWRDYGLFGFLADVRNYSEVPTIAEPAYVIPDDASPEVRAAWDQSKGDAHTATWLTAKQLLEFDYDQTFIDERIGGGEENRVTLRKFLGESFFKNLEALKNLGDSEEVRIIFWFDN